MRSFLIVLMMLAATTASAQVVYFDFFNGDPGFTVDSTIGDPDGEFAGVEDGAYKVRIHETTDFVNQMAYSPAFETLGDSEYEVMFDIMFPEMGNYMPMWATFAMADDPTNFGLKYTLSMPEAHLSIGDHTGNNTYYFHGVELGRWYRVWTRGNPDAGVATIIIEDPVTGEELYAVYNVALAPGTFNQFALGSETAHGGDSWSTIMVDNIIVDGPVPNEGATWGDVKALYR